MVLLDAGKLSLNVDLCNNKLFLKLMLLPISFYGDQLAFDVLDTALVAAARLILTLHLSFRSSQQL